MKTQRCTKPCLCFQLLWI